VTRVVICSTTTGYQIRSFGAAAEKHGVGLIFATDRCDHLDDPWADAAIPVRFHLEDASVAAVVAALRDAPPAGVIAVGDRPTVLAARIADAFGLPGSRPEAAAASRNKHASRTALRAAGLPTPAFERVALADDPAALARRQQYPVVLKPLALSGSRGVMRADDEAGFVAAFVRLRRLLQATDVLLERDTVHQDALIESFIPGREFAVEGVLTRGVFTPFAIFDKPDPLDGPFFEETIYVTPSRAAVDVQQRIVGAIDRAAHALGLWHGPIHAECRVDRDTVYVLEVAPRPIGGLCSKTLRFGGGVSLEDVLLRHAIGEDVRGVTREAAAAGVMMIPIPRRGVFRRVDGVERARVVAGIDDITITAKPDTRLLPLPEGRSYLGFIFARADTAAEVERALREAHARLRFAIDRELVIT
jgi:biotin carboxylase